VNVKHVNQTVAFGRCMISITAYVVVVVLHRTVYNFISVIAYIFDFYISWTVSILHEPCHNSIASAIRAPGH
jgi:hypothetical protein